jgi:PKD repeat protein
VAGVAVSFDGTDSSDDGTIVQYDWDFGDNSSGTGATTSHTYAAAGSYTVILTVTDDTQTTDSNATAATIDAVNQPPVADVNGPYTGTAGVAVSFDGTGSDDSDGTILSYDWDFGDNSTGTGATTSHVYGTSGNYNVTLTVTDDGGTPSAEAFTTAAIDSPDAPPVADADGPYVGKVDVPVDFDGTGSSDDGIIVQYDWDFGDGPVVNDAGATPSHTYADTGAYDVVLTVTDNNGGTAKSATRAIIGDGVNLPPTANPGGPYSGDEGVAVTFDGSLSDDADGTITFLWDFGDSNNSTGVSPAHTYAAPGMYLVMLTVTDDGGKTDTQTTVAAIGQGNRPPTANAGGPYGGTVGAPVLFEGPGSGDADGSLASAQWDFGDGAMDTGLVAVHTYTAPGPYTATLTVTDDDGATDQSTATVVIGDGNQPPTANANGPYTGTSGFTVVFDGTASDDPDGNILSYDWTFGDGESEPGPRPDNTYLGSGLYNVILQVTDEDGLTASVNTTADIGELSRRPEADAGGSYTGRVGVAVPFDAGASDDPDGDNLQYDWDFGDQVLAIDGGPTPSHTYTADGKYIVKLTVTDTSFETDVDVTTATIGIGNLPPVADAGVSVSGTVGRAITFDGAASSDPAGWITEYQWYFGDGSDSGPLAPAASKVTAAATAAPYRPAATSGENPVHTYDAPGSYFVVLTVTDNEGAVSSDVTVVDVASSSGGSSGGGSAFPGCSIGSHKVNDPILPLLVLLSVVYLARRRLGFV